MKGVVTTVSSMTGILSYFDADQQPLYPTFIFTADQHAVHLKVNSAQLKLGLLGISICLQMRIR